MNEHGAQEKQGIQIKTCPSVTLTNKSQWTGLGSNPGQMVTGPESYYESGVEGALHVHAHTCVCVHTHVCVTCRIKCVHLQYFCKVSIMKRMLSKHLLKKPCVKEKYSKQMENIKLTGSVLDRKKTRKCYIFS